TEVAATVDLPSLQLLVTQKGYNITLGELQLAMDEFKTATRLIAPKNMAAQSGRMLKIPLDGGGGDSFPESSTSPNTHRRTALWAVAGALVGVLVVAVDPEAEPALDELLPDWMDNLVPESWGG